jgi:hypothetical protein
MCCQQLTFKPWIKTKVSWLSVQIKKSWQNVGALEIRWDKLMFFCIKYVHSRRKRCFFPAAYT